MISVATKYSPTIAKIDIMVCDLRSANWNSFEPIVVSGKAIVVIVATNARLNNCHDGRTVLVKNFFVLMEKIKMSSVRELPINQLVCSNAAPPAMK